jgi:hypothetical protein
MKRKSHRIRRIIKVNPEDWPHDSFVGFASPHSGEYVTALRRAFPPEVIAAHVARLPAAARARLERQFPLINQVQ